MYNDNDRKKAESKVCNVKNVSRPLMTYIYIYIYTKKKMSTSRRNLEKVDNENKIFKKKKKE